jgi:iron complex transport system substrate-binding protein
MLDNEEVKIVSLLPSATEILFALGLGEDLRGVSFECDYPEPARSVPVVSGTALPTDGSLSASEIDAEVSARVAAGESIYTLDDARIRAIDPDLILAQDLCQVCAVPSGAVEDALEVIGCHALVVSLDPGRLDEVIECIGTVGAATGTSVAADRLMEALRGRVDAVRQRVRGRPRPRVLVLEWQDPPFNAGHWVPDQVEAAGGVPVLAAAGARSRRLTWEEIAAADVDITIFMPCGFDLEGAVAQAPGLLAHPQSAGLGRIVAVDANAYFSRPGPRVVDGVELLEQLLHGTPGCHHPGARVLRP